MRDPLIGQSIAEGRYEIIDKLGEGAMGEVYAARQVSVGRTVALKLIHVDAGRGFDAVARFQREMKLTAKLEHPHTVRVYDFGAWEGKLYLAMELLRGQTLRSELTRAGRFPLERVVHISRQILRALSAAHTEGIVHRDLKPENVMLIEQYGERDVVKVLDFGIAKSLHEDEQAKMTGQGAILGTPAYMSPEQAKGERVDARSDLYTLGIMLFEMASGRVPFEASSVTGLLVAHATEAPPPLSQRLPNADPRLSKLVSDLLEKNPDARPQSAREVEARLTTLHAQQTSPSERDGADARTPESPQKQERTSRALVSVIAVSLLVGLTAAAILGVELLHSQRGLSSAPPAAPAADAVLGGGPNQPAEAWEIQTILAAAGNELRALGLSLPPTECTGEAAAEAAVALVSARRALDKDPARAVASAEKAVAACPDWAAAYNVYGNALQASDRLDEAAEAYERALSLVPDYDAPRFNLGLVQLHRKDPAAIATFSQLIAQKPSYPDVYKSRGQAYVFAKRYREGLSDLEESLMRDPNDGTAWLMTAQLREQLKLPGAKDAYCKAAALNVEGAQQHCKH